MNEWQELVGDSHGEVIVDGYGGKRYTYASAIGLGKATTGGNFFHQTEQDQYVTKSSGLHDFTFT